MKRIIIFTLMLTTTVFAQNTKVIDMTLLSSADCSDDELIYVVDDPNGTDVDRKIARFEFLLGWAGSTNITTLGTIATGTWEGSIIDHERGGIEADISAIADGGLLVGTGAGTMAIRASFMTAGAAGTIKHELGGLEADVSAYESILAISGGTTLDLDTSAEMAIAIDDETGTGVMAFATSPTFTTSIILTGANAAPSGTGHIVYDNVTAGVENGMLSWHDSNEPRFLVDLFTLPSDDDYVVTYDADADKFYMASGGGGAGATLDKCKMTRDAAQTIGSAAWTKILFDNEEYDVGPIGVIGDSKVVIADTGHYMVTVYWLVDGIADGDPAYVGIYIDGTITIQNGGLGNQSNEHMFPSATDTYYLTSSQYVEMFVYHNEGGDIDTSTSESQKPRMSVVRMQ